MPSMRDLLQLLFAHESVINHADELLRIDVGDDHVGRERLTVVGHHTRGFLAFDENLRHLATGQHPAAVLLKHLSQGLDDGITAAHDAESATVVEVKDEGMRGKRRLVLLGSIERQVAHQHFAKQRVGDGLVDHFA